MEKNIEDGYKEYLIGKWIEAEKISTKLGVTENEVVTAIFDKICQPYFYWIKEK